MKARTVIPVAALVSVTTLGALGVGGRFWVANHLRRWSGRQDLAWASCLHCHGVSTARLAWAREKPRHPAPAGLALSFDGRRLYIALDEMNEVVEADTLSRRVIRSTSVPGGPTGLALDAKAERLFVTCRSGDRLAVLNLKSFTETGSVSVGTAPVAVACFTTRLGERLVVANAVSDDVSIVSVSPLEELGRLGAGREPFAVAPAPDGSHALVANRLAGITRTDSVPASELTVVDVAAMRVVARQALVSAHLSESVASVPGRSWALTPLVKVRNLVPITQVALGWVMSSGLAISDFQRGTVTELPLDEMNACFADPSGIAVDAAGRRAYIASGGGNVVSVVDLDRVGHWLEHATEAARQQAIDDLQLSSDYVLARIPTGPNPRQVVLSENGRLLCVAERLADSVLVVDTISLRPMGRIALGDGGDWDPIRRGERAFARASATFQGQFSCRSCHPDGHVDGLTYDFDVDGVGRDIVDNRSLQGVAGTGPFKWNGKNPSLAVQCGPRFARVLMRTEPFPKPELADLVAFIESLPPSRTLHPRGAPLTPAQDRGQKIFFATETPDGQEIPRARQCSTCHRPPLYTTRLSFDVATRGPRDNTGTFDTPHLLGIGASAPYLHDGRAATLEEIWTLYNPEDRHGMTSYMTKHQLNDLIEFLKTL